MDVSAVVALPRADCAPGGIVTNPLARTITLDGQFTGGVGAEWSDVTPSCFISPPTPNGTLVRTDNLADANSLLYAAVAPGLVASSVELYLMYAYVPRTNQIFAPGEFVADIAFPLTVRDFNTESLVSRKITVQIRGAQVVAQPSLFDVFVDQGNGQEFAGQFGIDADVGFGPSPLSTSPHLLVELEVPLLIPVNFFIDDGAGPLPPPNIPVSGPNGGGYSPLPAFWSASIANDGVDPPASGGVFTINPNGSTLIDSSRFPTTPNVPEPGTLALVGLGLAAVGIRRSRLRS